MVTKAAELIARWRASAVDLPDAATEAAYRSLWNDHAAGASEPLPMALLGGACADRLPWLFLAGYQGAVRAAFTLQTAGWLAFAASEDRSQEDPLPAVTLTTVDGVERLSGVKTWVAAVDHVDELIVLVGPREGARLFRIQRGRPGLSLSARSAAGFLGAMSQGQAAFDDLVLEARDELPPIALRDFPLYEAMHLYAAFAGFLATRPWLPDAAGRAAPLLELVDQLAASELTTLPGLRLLKRLDEAMQAEVVRLAADAGAQVPGWDADARLLSMYSKGVQRRAAQP